MKKLFTLILAVAITTLSLVTERANASHAVAADITYLYVGPNQFLLTLRLYRDCAGITAPTTASIQYTSSCYTGSSITLTKLPGSGQQIPPSPCIPPVVTACNGGPGYGVEEHIYQGVVTLPGPCVDWTFSYNLCCRNNQIGTLVGPAGFNLHVATTLDNFNFPTNSSPSFANIPVTQFCLNNQFFYSQMATDIDGDSLVYSLTPSLTNATTPVTYAAGYSFQNPLASSTPFTIDPQSGIISFTPSLLQVGVMAVKVDEYRNGVKIGYILRDMQMNVVSNCIGTVPTYVPPTDPSGNPAPYYSAFCGDTQFYMVLDQPIQCGSVVPTDIRVTTPQGTLNPVMSVQPVNCINGVTDSLLVTVFLPLTNGITWAYNKTGLDNNTFLSECGVQVPEFDSVPFNVIDAETFEMATVNLNCAFNEFTVTFNFEVVCNTLSGTSEFQLVDANGVIYPITSTNCAPTVNTVNSTITFDLGGYITPQSPVYLIAQTGSDLNTFANPCSTYVLPGDTIAELIINPNLIVDLGPDQTICSNDPFPILDAGIPNSTYEWFFNGVTTGITTQTIQTNAAGIYTVQVNSVTNCSGTDNFTLNVIQAPVISLGNDTILCANDVLILDAGNAGSTFQWFLNGTAITGATSQTYQPTTTGNYSVQVNTGGQCLGSGDIDVTVVQQLSVAVYDVAICSDQPFPVLDAGTPNITYSWTLNGVEVGTSQTFQPTQPGSYQVTISVGSCSATDVFTVGVANVPVIQLSNATVCPGDAFPVIDAGNPGMTYLWSNGETTQTIDPNAPGTYVVTVVNGMLGLNCTSTASATFAYFAPVQVQLGNDITVCENTGGSTIDAGNTGASFVWSLDGNVISGQSSQTLTVTAPGVYSVLVTDGNGCTGTDQMTLIVNPLPQVNIGNDTTFCSQDPLPLLSIANTNINTYAWTFNGDPIGSGSSVQATSYGTYGVTVIDNNGCEGYDEIIFEERPCEIEIPNVFTPGNGDGKNDTFFIKHLDTNPNTIVKILNRWGREVYSSSNYQNDWNGGDLPDGTYYYVVVLKSGKDYKGTLKLIRQK